MKCKAPKQVYPQTSHQDFCSSSVKWFGRNDIPLWFPPKSLEGFETDTHGEGAGLWTADMQGFVLWLFRSAFISSAAEGRPFPQGSRTENGSCHTGIVLVWFRLCGDSWPREGIRRQGGSIWMMLQQAEAPRSMIQIHTNAHIHVHADIFHTHRHRNIYCRNTRV